MFLQVIKYVQKSQSGEFWLLTFGYHRKFRFLKEKFKLSWKEIVCFGNRRCCY